jgi:hypothetical protein
MPKKVIEGFLRQLRREIASRFHSGDHFPALRELSASYGISYRVVHKAVRQLCAEGLLEARPNRGITVRSRCSPTDVTGKKIAFISGHNYRVHYEGFFAGVKKVAESEGVVASLVVNSRTDASSTSFGDYLLGLGVDGVLTLLLTDSALPLLYAHDRGLDIVSDFPFEELPILPAVFGDDYRYGRDVAQRAVSAGCKDILVVSLVADEERPGRAFFQRRYKGINAVLKENPGGRVRRANVASPGFAHEMNAFFSDFSAKSSVVTMDYDSIPVIASELLISRRMKLHCFVDHS